MSHNKQNKRRQLQSKLAEQKNVHDVLSHPLAKLPESPLKPNFDFTVQDLTNVPPQLIDQLKQCCTTRKLNSIDKMKRLPVQVELALNATPLKHRDILTAYVALSSSFIVAQDLIGTTLAQAGAANEDALKQAQSRVSELEGQVLQLQNLALGLSKAWMPPVEDTDEQHIREVRDGHLAMAAELSRRLPPEPVCVPQACVICYEESMNNTACFNPCGHVVCRDCAPSCLGKSCPYCRSIVRSYTKVFI